MQISLSVGKYAREPFCLEGLGVRVYCAEELCYCLKENAFLLDRDIMSDQLVRWLKQECGLEGLADELYAMIHKKGSLSAFVIRILEYVGFYDLEAMQEVERTLKKGAGLHILEKKKLRVDQLLTARKFAAALSEYDALLAAWEDHEQQADAPGASVRARILHNRGAAYAGLMRYDRAAESFWQAYETDRSEASLRCFLAAKRMEMSSGEYVSYVAGLPECSACALQLEKEVEQWNRKWETEADYKRLAARSDFRQEDERGYQEENAHILQSMKESYRSMSA